MANRHRGKMSDQLNLAATPGARGVSATAARRSLNYRATAISTQWLRARAHHGWSASTPSPSAPVEAGMPNAVRAFAKQRVDLPA
jgi:hypothetical protein